MEKCRKVLIIAETEKLAEDLEKLPDGVTSWELLQEIEKQFENYKSKQ